jgi:Family of unknown function (DUF6152)
VRQAGRKPAASVGSDIAEGVGRVYTDPVIGDKLSMTSRFFGLFLVGLLLAAAPVWAHHSFAAEYDNQKPVTHKGVVTKIDWMNPHVYIYIDEKSEDGKVVNLAFEGYPPNTLRRVGLARDMLKIGDSVSVTGWSSKDGSPRFAAREITWTDGRKFFIGPPAN